MPEEQAKPEKSNGWSKWQEFILHELRRLASAQEDIQTFVLELRLKAVRPEDFTDLKAEVKTHDERLDKAERKLGIILAVCGFLSPVVIWAIIEIIKALVGR